MSGKTPLVLLPGLLCDAVLWRHQVRDLVDLAEFHVADLTRHDTLGAMADSVLASAPPRFALAGLSMGGYVAMEIVRRAPDRVTRLALLDTTARPDTPEQTARRRGLIELAEKGRFKGVTPRLLPLLLHPRHLHDEAFVAEVTGMAERVGKEAFLRQQKAIMRRPDSRPDLARLTLPTLVLCGREDALTLLEAHEEMHALVKGSRLVVVEDCGHLSTLECPGEVTAAMRAWITLPA